MLARISAFAYGTGCYAVFLAAFLYAIGFLGNFRVPKGIDSGPGGPFWTALLVNAGLLGLFAVQHSVMARRGFKRVWTRIVPQPIERSTYVLFSSLALLLLFWLWRPMGGTVWAVDNEVGRYALFASYALGWALLLVSTFLINHFELFGLRQVYHYLKGETMPPLPFRTPALYQWVRHPIYLSWLMIFWSAPVMTVAHLVFAAATTAYILLAIRWEERDLIHQYGDAYRRYRQTVPMILPVPKAANAPVPAKMEA